MSVALDRARQYLRQYFGYDAFRPGQEDIVRAVLSGSDVVGVLPTGGGKSVCYQLPALIFPHLTLVVSPLIALMRDQTERLRQRGIAAAAIHGGMSAGDVNNALHEAHAGRMRLLYVAPERLESTTFRRQLRTIPLSLLAVDEAHCISEWGHDFRPSYQSIATLFDDRARVPILALTATATPDVRTDIRASLRLDHAVEIVRGFDRPNLAFQVERTAAKAEALTQLLKPHPSESAIVYCGSRRRVETLADDLRRRGVAAEAYHAGLQSRIRTEVQDRFVSGATPVLVATNAFGMGIDKADVRRVIHADLTLTLEAYYQEAGRAGRDGAPATCTLLYQPEDRRLMEFYIASTYPERSQIADVYEYICDRAGVPRGGVVTTPVLADSASIASSIHLPVATVQGVLTLLERAGVLMRATSHGNTRVQLRTHGDRITDLAAHAPVERRAVMDALARFCSGRDIGAEIDISPAELMKRTAITPREFSETMRSLHVARLIRYVPPQQDGGIVITSERVPAEQLPLEWQAIHERRSHAIQKLEVVVRYAETRQCKRNFILSYFGDATANGTCGRCTSCTGQTSKRRLTDRQTSAISVLIRTAWQVQGRFGRHVLVDVALGSISERVTQHRLDRCATWGALRDRTRHELLEALDVALDMGLLVKTADLYPTIGVTEEGMRIAEPLPSPLRAVSTSSHAASGLLDALIAWRERVAARDEVPESTLVHRDELERIAQDAPARVDGLQPGRHGSGLFIARYGAELIQCLSDTQQVQERAIPKVRCDDESVLVAGLVRPGVTLHDVARSARKTPPATAHALQRAIEGGLTIERHDLVDDRLYEDVYEYLRNHRFAKLRHVREHVGEDVDLAVLRLAMAFARRDLYATS
jgi:ATP-dependent DNA helicase RecQ